MLILVSVLSVVSFVTSAQNYVTSSQNLKHYNDSEISFDFPQNWVISNYENPIETFFSSEPGNLTITRHDSGSQNYPSNITQTNSAPDPSNPTMTTVTITKTDSLPSGITLENVYKANGFYNLVEQTPGYTFVSQNRATVDGAAGYDFIYGDEMDKYYEVWFEKNGKFYGITCETLKESFDSEKNNFNTIVTSFHVK